MEDPLVIADLTEGNPNVFYELAIRHLVRMPFVQLIKKGQSLPFDLIDTRTISYDFDVDEINKAKEELSGQVSHLPAREAIRTPISVAIDLRSLERSPDPGQNVLRDLAENVTGIQGVISQMQKSLTTVTRNITQQDERLSTLFDKIDRISGEKITSAARAETVFRALTVRELLRRESLREDEEWGELLLGCSVYVNMAMPLESEAGTYARQVMKNIYGGVNYCYVLEFSERNANRIADMVVRLARTGGDARGGVTEDNKTVYDNMHRLRSHFRIYMVHNVGFEYCVFNADVREHAHCYLRLAHWTSEEGTRWLDWASGHAAFVIAEQIDRLRLDGEDKERIIKGSKGCDFYNDDRLRSEGQDFTNRLRAEIKRAVAERQLAEDLISMCIG